MSNGSRNRLLRPVSTGLLFFAAGLLTGARAGGPDPDLINDQARDNSLHIGIVSDGETRTLHPALLPDGPWRWIMSQVYGPGLIEPQQNGLQGRAMLAEEYPGADDITEFSVTFRLRRGVKFHNGSELGVEDIKNSFSVFAQLVQNEHPYVDYAFRFVDRVEVDSESNEVTIVMQNGGMTAQALRLAAIPPLAPVLYEDLLNPPQDINIIRELERRMTRVTTVTGLGGYEVEVIPAGNQIQLQAFPDYYEGRPQVREVTVHIYANDREATQAYITNEIKMVRLPTFHSFQALLSQLPGSPQERGSVPIYYPWRNHHFFFLAFNNQIEPLNISELRRALPYAIKRKDTEFRDEMPGYSPINDLPIHPKKSELAEYLSLPPRGYLPRAGALRRIRESGMNTTRLGYPRDEQGRQYELTLIYPNHVSHYETMARRIKNDLERLEFIIEPQAIDPDEVRRRMRDGDYELALFEMTLPPTPEMLQRLFHSSYAPSGINFTRYMNGDFDVYISTALQRGNPDRVRDLENAIWKLEQEMPLLCLYFQSNEYYFFNGIVLNGASLGRVLNRMEPMARWRWAR